MIETPHAREVKTARQTEVGDGQACEATDAYGRQASQSSHEGLERTMHWQ
jgi:hypothetical protein